jgi:predicted NBD/HSP70 family sugar kinase
VLYATHLGWPDDADPARELRLDRLALVVNDAVAAALGESILREGGRPERDLVYVSLGTGVGSAVVDGGVASDLDLGHRLIGGALYCDGCRNTGCLNSELSSRRLPARLAQQDQERAARLLAVALEGVAPDEQMLVVVGGGIGRRYPDIASRLDRLIPNPAQVTIAPAEAKSSAYAGLDYLTRTQPRL